MIVEALLCGRVQGRDPYEYGLYSKWTVVHSCSLFQSENVGVAAAGEADFGGEGFLEGQAFG